MPSTLPRSARQHERLSAKLHVVRVFREGEDWRLVAIHNDVPYSTARCAILNGGAKPKRRGGVLPLRVKMTVAVMAKLEDLINEDYRMTENNLRDRLRSGIGVSLEAASHQKSTMNNTTNKDKHKIFVQQLNMHAEGGIMIVCQDKTNFNLYLPRKQGWSRVGECAQVALPHYRGKNLNVQDGVSSGIEVVLLRTHDGSIGMYENGRFIADFFVATLRAEEYKQLEPSSKVVVVTDNAPAHSREEILAQQKLASDGIMDSSKLVVLWLAPYSFMLNPIEGCWSVLKSHMRHFIV